MLKIFSTQMNGYFKRILEQEELHIEDGARMLAQALISNHTIYMYGTNEMEGVVLEALHGEERLQNAKAFTDIDELTTSDRVMIITRFSTDEEAITLAKQLQAQGHTIVGISAKKESEETLEQFTDVHIDTKLIKPLIPDEDGSRYGFPSLIIALFAYYGLKFTTEEIIKEY